MIEGVWDVFKAALLPINLPFTAGLLIVMMYWLLVILGALDFDMGGHDIHLDAHGADAQGGHDGTSNHLSQGGSVGGLQAVLQYLHIGDTPSMVVISVMALIAWAFAVLINVYFNPGNSLLLGLVFLVPNAIFTMVSTHYLLRPVSKLIRRMNEDAERAPAMIGQIGEVTTSEVTEKFGMALVEIKGAPLAIQIRSTKGEPIKKGDKVLVIDEDKAKNTFEVVKYQPTELEE